MRSLPRRAMVSLLAVSTMSLGSLFVRPAAAETLVAYTAVLNGAQETPVPIESPSQGVALVLLVKETNKVCYRLSYSPLAGTEILAHFHGPAAPGTSAPVVVNLSPATSPFGSP